MLKPSALNSPAGSARAETSSNKIPNGRTAASRTRGDDGLPFRVVTDADGSISYINEAAAAVLGQPRGSLVGATLWDFADRSSQTRLAEWFTQTSRYSEPLVRRLRFRHSNGTTVAVLAAVTLVANANGATTLHFRGLDDGERSRYIDELENNIDILTGIVDASTEAIWCTEYTEPINLRRNTQEIMRQVFDNKSHWRICNGAMARLYNLPENLDISRQPPSTYFRRNPESEAFVRQLIDAKFEIDSAPSLEYTHDGKVLYVENTVRCRIESDEIHRMWGTVRDITEFRTTQNILAEREREVAAILNALPDAILVVDMSRRAVAVNLAFETTFGWRAEDVLGKDVTPIINLEAKRPGARRWFAPTQGRWLANVSSAQRKTQRCDVRIAPVQIDTGHRFVLSMRPVLKLPRKEPRTKSAVLRKSPPAVSATRKLRSRTR